VNRIDTLCSLVLFWLSFAFIFEKNYLYSYTLLKNKYLKIIFMKKKINNSIKLTFFFFFRMIEKLCLKSCRLIAKKRILRMLF
jgi:hypothetical protein